MEKSIALYIHIPFCKQKCLYCDFPSFSSKDKLMDSYTEALCIEIEKINNKLIKTIFIGGGTPTYLSIENWRKISKTIARLNLESDYEFTIEGNPGSFTFEKLKCFKEMGVNRLSIGLQAFQDYHLKALGRIHNVQDFINTYNAAREIGFDNINFDIMFGLPGQTLEEWEDTLRKSIELQPEHISCYSLIIEEGTPFYKLYEKGSLHLPEEDEERKMYHLTLKLLESKGYIHYEISNFSKPEKECRHNLIYWSLENYIGCGSGAHSYMDGYRYRNTESIEEYIMKINTEKTAVVEKNKNTIDDDMEEFMFMGLRKIAGISIDEFERRFNTSFDKIYGTVVQKHIKNKLLVKEEGRLFLTPRGIELSNTVMSDFII
jgi:oxygen-independent coproporphyrinogen-3 oxidase